MKGKIYIGTSGWSYKHWKGTFYPEELKEAGQLEFIAQHFNSVELNNSFYRLPTAATFDDWRNKVPKDFVFAVKGSRYITHMKKLKVEKEEVAHFLDRAMGLKEKLGVVLFQLHPAMKKNMERLEHFLNLLPPSLRFTLEFRNHSWYGDDVYDLLSRYKVSFCIYELDRHLSPIQVTADFVYLRLHGPGAKYQGSYSDETLKSWAQRCIEWQKAGKDVFVYFDNDQKGYAAFNAQRLKELVSKKS